MMKNINLIKEIVECMSGLEIDSFKNTREDLVNYIKSKSEIIAPGIIMNYDVMDRLKGVKPNSVYEFRAPFEIVYFAFYSLQNKMVYVIGPTLTEPFNKKKTEKQIKEYGLDAEKSEQIIKYCSRLPVVNYVTLHDLSAILAKELCGTARFMSHETIDYFPQTQGEIVEMPKPPSELYKIRQVESQYEMNNALIEAVKLGNVSLALRILGQYSHKADFQVRNANPLRNTQNYCIILNTQLRRALEENHIHPFILDALSSEIGTQIEKLKTVDEAQEFIVYSIRRYCKLAKETRLPDLCPLVNLSVTYIKEHITEDLTVKKAAEQLSVNANYLSTVFKRDMGISFIDYVNQERINQAEALLTKTNLPIGQVATTVGYNNTSYFAKQFVRFKGVTPTEYRKK